MPLREIGAILLWGLSVVAMLGVLAFGWFVRDGLGPDAVESHGLTAIQRIWESGVCWGFAFFAAPLAATGFLLYLKRYNRGIVILLGAYLGASLCFLGCSWVFVGRNFSQSNSMSEDAIFGLTLQYIVLPIALCVGGAIGGTASWRLTRTRSQVHN